MQILLWISGIIGIYFFIVFVVLRLVVPFMGFGKYEPQTFVTDEIKNQIVELENLSHDQLSYLQAVYNFILEKNRKQWKHTRGQAAIRLPRLFVKDLTEIWQTTDFVYCTAINFVIYSLLINSIFFQIEDIRAQHVFVNMVIHQYLQVRVNGKWIDIDPAGTGIRGKPLGYHLSIFG